LSCLKQFKKLEIMKVKDLINQLEKIDPNVDVYVPSTLTEFDYCIVQSVKPKWLTIEESEDYPDQTLVLVIDEC